MNVKTETKLLHDGTLYIATGTSRKDTNWRNVETTWSKLVDRLRQTKRTNETFMEYVTAPKAQQDEIKDVGGYVGGMLKAGRRKADAVQSRQLLTLDADHLLDHEALMMNVDVLLGCASAFYTTHKHSAKSPRGRLVLPLSRPILPEEYEALGRIIAGELGIDLFDDSTYEPHRLMYWPSTAKDGEYYFDATDAPWLDVDSWLSRLPDWRDPSYWPESSRVQGERRKLADKQGNPLEKPGLIGAFCREYTVPEAIEMYLSDVYEPCADGHRFSLIGGTTAGGLVIYEDGLFAYSNHATDAISRKLVNAWDIVRLHKFGSLDEDVEPSTPVNRLPSMAAMEELANRDDAVRQRLMMERLAEAAEAFDELPPETDWMTKLATHHKTGAILPTTSNLMLILENDPRLAGKVGLDEFSHRFIIKDDLPWRKIAGRTNWSDADDACLRNYLDKVYRVAAPGKVADAIAEVFEKHRFHPVREYLLGLEWDGLERLDTLLIDYLGAADSAYVRAATRKTLSAAVARVMHPGCKFDQMLVLVGEQGIGKSSLFQRLAGKWFSDSLTTVHGKEAYEQLQGYWVHELGELSATRKSEVESVKLFLSKQRDSFRAAYGRHMNDYDRQCIFIGTTNDHNFLKDRTGNRRFWPVEVERSARSVFELNQIEIDMIWAEAVQAWRDGETLYMEGTLLEKAQEVQALHFDENPRQGLIEDYLERLLPADWEERSTFERRTWLLDPANLDKGEMVRDKVCALEVWCELFGGDSRSFTKQDQFEINSILKCIPEWTLYRGRTGNNKLRFRNYGVQRCYIRRFPTHA